MVLIHPVDDNEQLRQAIRRGVGNLHFDLVLYTEEKKGGETSLKGIDFFPIQWNTCMIADEGHAGFGLCFDRKKFLLRCVGKEKIKGVNDSKKRIWNTLERIEEAVGKTDFVEELREDIKEFLISVDSCFDYSKK